MISDQFKPEDSSILLPVDELVKSVSLSYVYRFRRTYLFSRSFGTRMRHKIDVLLPSLLFLLSINEAYYIRYILCK